MVQSPLCFFVYILILMFLDRIGAPPLGPDIGDRSPPIGDRSPPIGDRPPIGDSPPPIVSRLRTQSSGSTSSGSTSSGSGSSSSISYKRLFPIPGEADYAKFFYAFKDELIHREDDLMGISRLDTPDDMARAAALEQEVRAMEFELQRQRDFLGLGLSASRASSPETDLSLSAMERLNVEDLSTELFATYSDEFPVPISFCSRAERVRLSASGSFPEAPVLGHRSSKGLPQDAPELAPRSSSSGFVLPDAPELVRKSSREAPPERLGLGHKRSSDELPPALSLGSHRFKKCLALSSEPRPRDSVVLLLEAIKRIAKDDDRIYKDLSTERDFFYRLGGFELHVSVDGDIYAVRMPLYVVYDGTPFQWYFYALPDNFYEIVKQRRTDPRVVALLKEEGIAVADLNTLNSNMDLKPMDMLMFSVYEDGGAQISVNVDPHFHKTATIENIHWKKGMQPEYTVRKWERKGASASTKKGLFAGISAPFPETRMKLRIKNAGWSAAFSKALETLWKKLGVSLLKCSDQAYIPCGDEALVGNAAISMLFLRIFGTQKNSYYMKSPFLFNIGEDNPAFPTQRHVTKRQQFDAIVMALHTTPFGEVMRELEAAGREKQKGLYQEALAVYRTLSAKHTHVPGGPDPPEIKRQIEIMRKLQQSYDENYYKGYDDRFRGKRDPDAWYKKIIDLSAMVKEQNKKNTNKEYRRVGEFKSDLERVSMGDVMTMLWYHGKRGECKKYMEVFEFIFGKFNPDTRETKVTLATPYGDLMHHAHLAVQYLVRELEIDDDAVLTESHDVPKLPLFLYLQRSLDLNHISPWTGVIILCVCALSCLCGLYCCFTKAYHDGYDVVSKDKEPHQYDPVDNNA
eukprot:418935_1